MNILVNTYCNLHCSYCFATDVMNSSTKKNMSENDFRYVLDFLRKNGVGTVRLIGGEPTIFPNLERFIDIIISYNCFSDIFIFSNFCFSQDVADMLIEKMKFIKISFLPNINELNLLLPNQRERIEANLEQFFGKAKWQQNIGINIYRPDMNFDQWEEIIKKYNDKIAALRYSIAIPQKEKLNDNFDFYQHHRQYEESLWKLIDICERYHIRLVDDCNNLPLCCFSDKLVARMVRYGFETLTPSGRDGCGFPAIDCQPDLTITTCFGYGSYAESRLTLRDFNNFDDLIKYCEDIGDTSDYIARIECLMCPKYLKSDISCSCKSMHLIDKYTLNKRILN